MNSITTTVIRDGLTRLWIPTVGFLSLEDVPQWVEIPPRLSSYHVTYRLDSKGELEVYRPHRDSGIGILPRNRPFHWRHWLQVCWLPPEWEGLTVTRTISNGGIHL